MSASVIFLAVLIIPTIAVQLAKLVAQAGDFLETLVDEYRDARDGAVLAAVSLEFQLSPECAYRSEALQGARPKE